MSPPQPQPPGAPVPARTCSAAMTAPPLPLPASAAPAVGGAPNSDWSRGATGSPYWLSCVLHHGGWGTGCNRSFLVRGQPPPSPVGTPLHTPTTPCNRNLAIYTHRITESQNGRGWKRPLWVMESNPPAETGSPTAGCTGHCPGRS